MEVFWKERCTSVMGFDTGLHRGRNSSSIAKQAASSEQKKQLARQGRRQMETTKRPGPVTSPARGLYQHRNSPVRVIPSHVLDVATTRAALSLLGRRRVAPEPSHHFPSLTGAAPRRAALRLSQPKAT
ncbi:hypothetical protein O9K51_03004 [Purpureocillium lavendulum]|uniref:Uncharacterized protein n=1 Tax=Purpureocillium lavendulum TaxID=1247861 RepID=A0AB34G004_9HYPO|nr:hypothetical protein O9K51_03004 [Purpureocillium lavendulum]